jgi:hypothetical protein
MLIGITCAADHLNYYVEFSLFLALILTMTIPRGDIDI